MQKLSVIIPAYKEAQRIESTLKKIQSFLQAQSYTHEVLVVVDGSPDNTAEVVEGCRSWFPELKLINNTENKGKGAVVKQGMLAATGDVRLFMDADGSTAVDHISSFLPYFEKGYDVVVGSRRTKGANIAVHQPLLRDFLGGVFRLIVHTLVPVHVSDSQCGFKAFTAEATQKVFPKQTIERFAFDVEILAIARKAGLKIEEAPVTWINDGASTVKFTWMVQMLLEIVLIRLNLWAGKYR